jgi:hypothetical protein
MKEYKEIGSDGAPPMPNAHPQRLVCDDAYIQSFEGGTISASDGLGRLAWNYQMKFLGRLYIYVYIYVYMSTCNKHICIYLSI